MATKIYAEINKNPSAKELIKFGATFLGGMAVIGLLYYFVFHNEPLAKGLWIAGGVVFALSFIPPVARILYILWMGLGITMGLVTSPIILALVFLVLITPVGLVFKLIQRDTMKRKMDRGAASYWEEYKETDDPATYVKQF
ncbi:MAG: SxtJ family membrane protein [Byssovorax sp.]